jgi:hypothetical protein
MFFRRDKPKIPTFSERVDLLKKAGFVTQPLPDGRVLIAKHGVGAVILDEGGEEKKNQLQIERAGILVGHKIAVLLSAGYQMFLELPEGQRLPASAEQLENLHAFEEDVKEALGVTNLYNTSLGTTSRKHEYDRVDQRDTGRQPRPWEKRETRIVAPATKDSVPL